MPSVSTSRTNTPSAFSTSSSGASSAAGPAQASVSPIRPAHCAQEEHVPRSKRQSSSAAICHLVLNVIYIDMPYWVVIRMQHHCLCSDAVDNFTCA